jgi:hypothetical protein
MLEDLLDARDARHAVADDDQLFHELPRVARSTRTAHCL